MHSFKSFLLLTEVRHAFFQQPIKLHITQPIKHNNTTYQWETKDQVCAGIDMKFEFYTNPIHIQNSAWLQQFPADVRTRPGQVLINEGYSKDHEMYWLDIPPVQLSTILAEGHAYVDIHTHRLVTHTNSSETVKVLLINPLPKSVSIHQLKHKEIGIREGWDQKSDFSWFDFCELTGEDDNYVKRSCHLDPSELVQRLDQLGAA